MASRIAAVAAPKAVTLSRLQPSAYVPPIDLDLLGGGNNWPGNMRPQLSHQIGATQVQLMAVVNTNGPCPNKSVPAKPTSRR
jgi:hypothetical protein